MFRRVGIITSSAVFFLGIAYALTTLLGLLSLPSSQDPISDPYFTLMEILTILIAPLMAISMIAIHDYALPKDKKFSLAASFFMFIMTGITSCVHFLIFILSHSAETKQLKEYEFFFSFKWPSVVYILDILAWDWFYALSVLFAAVVFSTGRLEKTIRWLLILSGLLSLAGLVGVALNNMQVRNTGIIGYAVIAPVAFLLIAKILHSTRHSSVSAAVK